MEYVLVGICVFLVLLPTKWDPAIRLKEWMTRGKEHKEIRKP